MKFRTLTQWLTPWLTLYLLVVSVGLPLQRVYCACIGESTLGLPGEAHECGAHAPQKSEHDHHRSACCKVTRECQQADSVGHSCGDTEVFVAQFSADYLATFSVDYLIFALQGVVPAWPDYRPDEVQAIAKARPIRGPDPPARPAGRQLLVAYQTFLI